MMSGSKAPDFDPYSNNQRRNTDMYNDILTIGPLTVHGYGLMIAIGILCALAAGVHHAKYKGLSPDEVYNLTFICVIAGMASAKILTFRLCTEWSTIISNPAVFKCRMLYNGRSAVLICKKRTPGRKMRCVIPHHVQYRSFSY